MDAFGYTPTPFLSVKRSCEPATPASSRVRRVGAGDVTKQMISVVLSVTAEIDCRPKPYFLIIRNAQYEAVTEATLAEGSVTSAQRNDGVTAVY